MATPVQAASVSVNTDISILILRVTLLRISYTRHITNESVRNTTACLPVSERVKSFRFRFFRHLARSNPKEDHHRVIAAALRPPSDWRRHAGRPRTTWLRTISLIAVTEFRGSHGMEEGKGERYLA